jgi:hypothetical protein
MIATSQREQRVPRVAMAGVPVFRQGQEAAHTRVRNPSTESQNGSHYWPGCVAAKHGPVAGQVVQGDVQPLTAEPVQRGERFCDACVRPRFPVRAM